MLSNSTVPDLDMAPSDTCCLCVVVITRTAKFTLSHCSLSTPWTTLSCFCPFSLPSAP